MNITLSFGLYFLFSLALSFPLLAETSKIQLANGAWISQAQLDQFLQQKMRDLQMPAMSIAVIRGNNIVYHRTLGVTRLGTLQPVTSQHLFDAASLTKTVFAYLTLRLVDQGLLQLDQPLYTYLPHPDLTNDERHKLITARMVLSHSTGLPNWRFGKPLSFKFTPGTSVQYSGEAFEYLAMVIAHLKRIEKNALDDLFQTEVAAPLGMKHSFTVWNSYLQQHRIGGHINGQPSEGWGLSASRPNFAAAFSLNTEAVDYAKFLIGLFEAKGLSQRSYQQMLSLHTTDHKSVPKRNWGLGIEMKTGKYGQKYLHSGNNDNFSSHFVYLQEQAFGYVFFTNSEHAFVANQAIETLFTGDD